MPPKAAATKGSKADALAPLLKCVIKYVLASSEKPVSIPWPTVAGYMPGDPKPDTLRKRFDKTKKEIMEMGAGGAGMEAGGDVDFMKAILKVLLGAKTSIKWAEVAVWLPDEPKPDTLRKRFDGIKKELAAMGGGTSEVEDSVQPTADVAEFPKAKKAPAKPRKKREAEDGDGEKAKKVTKKRALAKDADDEGGEDGVKVVKKPRKAAAPPPAEVESAEEEEE